MDAGIEKKFATNQDQYDMTLFPLDEELKYFQNINDEENSIIHNHSSLYEDYEPVEKYPSISNSEDQSILKAIENKSTETKETKENNNKKENKNIFITKTILNTKQKRGVKPNIKSDEILHPWDSYDLLFIKIQAHYINYLIDLANDAASIVFDNKIYRNYFLNISYKAKNKRLNQIEKYKDVFKLAISGKNKGIKGLSEEQKKQFNHNMYNDICKNSLILRDFFEQSYMDMFKNYYFKNVRIINYKELHIELSEQTKTYNDLLNKDDNKNAENKFLIIVKKYYFGL